MRKILCNFFSLVVLFIITYVLAVLILSRIPVHADYMPTPVNQTGIDIYVRTNGVHTDIVLPIKTSAHNWENLIPPSDLHNTDEHLPYMSFGWGDKGFYLDTPSWAELKVSTAIIAATGIGSTAMHVEAVKKPLINDKVRHLRINEDQLKAIINEINNSFTYDANGHVEPITTTANYNDHDAFYEAKGRYSLFMTCNEWTSDVLSSAGIKTAAFTPMQDGVMRFLP